MSNQDPEHYPGRLAWVAPAVLAAVAVVLSLWSILID